MAELKAQRVPQLQEQRVLHEAESKQCGLGTQVAPVNEEIKAIETQFKPQGQQWLDTKTAVMVISPATFSVPAQT